MVGVGGLLKEHCEQSSEGRITSDELAERLRKEGYRFSSSFLRGVMTGKNIPSYRLLEGCEKVFSLPTGDLTRFAVGYFAEQLAQRHNLSVRQVSDLLKEYLQCSGAVPSGEAAPAPAPEEVGEGKAESPGEAGVTHKRTIRSLMLTWGLRAAPFCYPPLSVCEAQSPIG
ncbi:hypothetical protein LCGC14_2328510 [marine sediment metagenome]|uniref:Uncharacterized protein n=1 Tax=marine sediment metagenome TaxID=412755 RepID=A0A0F9ET83_9ZZZZ